MLIDITRAVGGYLHDVFIGNADWGILIGYVAQILFAMRFVVQWIASERAGKSVVPTAFWVFSIGGGMMLLGYALYRRTRCSSSGRPSACSSICAICNSSSAAAGRARRREIYLRARPSPRSRVRDRRSDRPVSSRPM